MLRSSQLCAQGSTLTELMGPHVALRIKSVLATCKTALPTILSLQSILHIFKLGIQKPQKEKLKVHVRGEWAVILWNLLTSMLKGYLGLVFLQEIYFGKLITKEDSLGSQPPVPCSELLARSWAGSSSPSLNRDGICFLSVSNITVHGCLLLRKRITPANAFYLGLCSVQLANQRDIGEQ